MARAAIVPDEAHELGGAARIGIARVGRSRDPEGKCRDDVPHRRTRYKATIQLTSFFSSSSEIFAAGFGGMGTGP